jgi:hypothetical protein
MSRRPGTPWPSLRLGQGPPDVTRGHLVSKAVQSGSQVVHNVPDDRADRHRDRLPDVSPDGDLAGGIGGLSHDLDRVGSAVSVYFMSQRSEMLGRPAELRPPRRARFHPRLVDAHPVTRRSRLVALDRVEGTSATPPCAEDQRTSLVRVLYGGY